MLYLYVKTILYVKQNVIVKWLRTVLYYHENQLIIPKTIDKLIINLLFNNHTPLFFSDVTIRLRSRKKARI